MAATTEIGMTGTAEMDELRFGRMKGTGYAEGTSVIWHSSFSLRFSIDYKFAFSQRKTEAYRKIS
jgi:hypothetical protein